MHTSMHNLIFEVAFRALFWLVRGGCGGSLLSLTATRVTPISILGKFALVIATGGPGAILGALMPGRKEGTPAMAVNFFLIGFYAFFWAVRINGCIRRGRQPLLRGREWFFNIHVQPDFYAGAGREILHRYWMRMLIPFAVDIPLAVAIFVSGRLMLLNLLILGLCALIHINHCYSVDLAERKARRFAVAEAERPVVSIALCLKPRRLRDYTNRKLEWVMGLSTAFTLVWLVRYYFAAPEHHHLRVVFAAPLFLLYTQIGALLVKGIVLAWRAPFPESQAAEHLKACEETRKYYLKQCDWIRASATAAMLFSLVQFSVPPALYGRALSVWLAAWSGITLVATVWQEIKRKRLVRLALRTQPVRFPDFLHQSEMARWPLCYQPTAPMLVLKGAHGYSLNLANRLSHLGAAYLMGLVALFGLLSIGH